MPDRKFRLQIITPQRVLYNDEVESVRAPGALGSLQVLYGHIPFLTPLEVGEIAIRHEGSEEFIATSGGGILQVEKDGVIILAETAEWAHEIDVERSEKAMMRAKERLSLSSRDPNIDVNRAQVALAKAANRLKVARRAR